MNISEKILAKASNKEEVSPGDTITANIDVAMSHDCLLYTSKRILSRTNMKN